MNNNSKEQLAKIRWNCRRGMLELDIILQKFFDDEYLQLSSAEQQTFKKLLDCTDQDLYEWLMGKKTSQDGEFIKLIARIRAK